MSTFKHLTNTIICPALNLQPPNAPLGLLSSEIAFFSSIPWTASLLSAPSVIPFIPSGRNPASPVHDQLFGNTLNNARGLSHMLSFFHAPSPSAAKEANRNITEIVTLVEAGDGVSGFPGLMHGGISASLLDESMGNILDLNGALRKEARAFTTPNVTGGLDIKYLKPVPTNAVLYIRAIVEEMDGRKTKIRGEIKNENGEVLVKCESKWIALKASL